MMWSKPLKRRESGMTWLPMWLLSGVSTVAAFVLHRIVRYRRALVRDNLRKCFPGKSERELRAVEGRFYRNFADCFVEALKQLSVTDRWMREHVHYENLRVVDEYFAQGRTVMAYFSHAGNWEWGTSIALNTRLRPEKGECIFSQIYRPLRNVRADALFLRLRSRFGTHSIAKTDTVRSLIRLSRGGVPSITGFMSDQKPSGHDGYITTFLNRPTKIIQGTETLARKIDAAVVYMDIRRTSRHHYTIRIVDMASHASTTAPGELTERYTRLLEETINADPSAWLWTHNRWKHPVTLPAPDQA